MWEFFPTKLAGCLLESCSQKCKAIIHVTWLSIAMGSLLSRVKPQKQGPCLQNYPNFVVFVENHCSPVLWVPMHQALMLIVTRAEVLRGDWRPTACQAWYWWADIATSPFCMARGKGLHLPTMLRHPHVGSLSQEGEWDFWHPHCVQVKQGWRAGFFQDVPEGLGHFPLLHISVPGAASALNCHGKANKRAKSEANQKTRKSSREDAAAS